VKSNLTRRPIALAVVLLPLFLTFGTKSAIAQITPAKDGTGTVVQTQNNQINISGGTQAGSNQFHSFQQFGVNAGQTANFMANPNIANILGRVTGGDASLINGILKVSGSNANLFLMNPAGIVFGKDASLNVPGAFTATTANGIGFGNGNWFNAVGSNNYATLTSNPTSFGFIGTSGSLVNAGNLSVNPGQSIALVGGTVVNTGTIAAPGGNITIAAIPGGKMVRIGQDGMVLSLDLPTSDRALVNAPITTPLSLPALLTGGSVPIAMGVVVEDGVIKLTGGSASVSGTLNADGTGSQNGGNVIAYADNHLSFGGTIVAKGGELGGNGGFVETSGRGTIAISPNAKVLTTAAKGLTGTWLIDPADLTVVATGGTGTIATGTNSPTTASTIDAGTIVKALNGTNVDLQATNSITVNAAINASANASAGNLKLSAPTANLNQAIVLKTGSTLSGTATTVNVGANGTVQNGIDVSAAGGTVNLAAATYTLASTVGINKNVIVRGAGAGTTTVSGNNAVGVFNIASGTVTLEGMSIVKGKATNGGGISFTSSGILNVKNIILNNNNAIDYGGGIYQNGGTINISDSVFSSNTVNGSSYYNYGGGIANLGATSSLNITRSTFMNNIAAFVGGGVWNSGSLAITDSAFFGNTASSGYGYGGAIETFNTSVLTNLTISNNKALFGGGINNWGTTTIKNVTVVGNEAQLSGGGINNTDGSEGGSGVASATIINSIVSGNTNSSAPM
jgi:filamentous hemagglutinin family protein